MYAVPHLAGKRLCPGSSAASELCPSRRRLSRASGSRAAEAVATQLELASPQQRSLPIMMGGSVNQESPQGALSTNGRTWKRDECEDATENRPAINLGVFEPRQNKQTIHDGCRDLYRACRSAGAAAASDVEPAANRLGRAKRGSAQLWLRGANAKRASTTQTSNRATLAQPHTNNSTTHSNQRRWPFCKTRSRTRRTRLLTP